MTQPDDTPPLGEGTDITAASQDLETTDPADSEHRPASSDPEELTDGGALGGAGGAGGAG